MSNSMKVKLIALLVIIMLYGWMKNIFKLADCDFQAPYKAEVIHTLGLVPPIGMFTGWFTIDGEEYAE